MIRQLHGDILIQTDRILTEICFLPKADRGRLCTVRQSKRFFPCHPVRHILALNSFNGGQLGKSVCFNTPYFSTKHCGGVRFKGTCSMSKTEVKIQLFNTILYNDAMSVLSF